MIRTLHAHDLVKRYGSRSAVDEVSLAVGPGEVVGLLGPNGAGKTTTFNMMVGRIRPTAGVSLQAGPIISQNASLNAMALST